MFREWSIADGPAELTDRDVNTVCTFTLVSGESLLISITHVGRMHGGNIHSFSGTIYSDHPHEVIGTYNTLDRTGYCHTTKPDA